MVVLITNVTDGPGKKPKEVRVYNKRLRPGTDIRVDAKYVDAKVRKLEDAGFIVIGPVPAWYADYAAKRQTKNLSSGQVAEKLKAEKAHKAKRKAAKMATSAPKSAPAPAPAPAPVVTASISDKVEVSDSSSVSEKKGSKKNKKRG